MKKIIEEVRNQNMDYEEKALEYIKNVFLKTDKAHDYMHSYRVYKNALNILSDIEVANREIVALAAILHDVDDKKLFNSKRKNNIDIWFEKYPSKFETKIRKAISEVSFSSGKKPTFIESEIVQDADRLDAIGAIGIARVFTYGGKIGRDIYSNDGMSSISHFNEKLFKIKDMMNTRKAKEIAQGRDFFMHQFVERFREEIEGRK